MDMSITAIPVELIVAGNNPRKLFEDIDALAASIKSVGLTTPITVRPYQDGFQLIAGERRLRAFKIAFGEDASIPGFIVDVDDQTADAMALAENIERKAMTPVEEAEAAAKILAYSKNDRNETARRMGWSRPTLDRRLGLMNCSEKVRAALQGGQIDLGHAEILAGCRREAQDKILSGFAKKRPTVAELKGIIESKTLILSAAIFDKTECGECPHNSSRQATMFSETVSDGRCTNPGCYTEKTESALIALQEGLKEEFQVVRIVRAGENLTLHPLKGGNTGTPKTVSHEQAEACKLCGNYGAVVSAVPDKLGKVYKSICMDVPCFKKHEAANNPKVPVPPTTTKAPPTPAAKPNAAAPVAAPAGPKKAATTPEPSQRLKEYREKLWRKVMAAEMARNAVLSKVAILAVLALRPSAVNSVAVLEGMGMQGELAIGNLAQKLWTESSEKVLDSHLVGIAQKFSSDMLPIKDVVAFLQMAEAKLEAHWTLDAEFLDLLTKNEIDAVCQELGIKQALGKSFDKTAKKPELISTILKTPSLSATKFTFAGLIPNVLKF